MRPLVSTGWTGGTTGEWSTPDTPDALTKRRPLTIRTIDEILAMRFDPNDSIVKNGYFTAGDLTAICGPGGVGKSRLAMQFALDCRAGQNFLEWKTNGRELRFLFLPTENSCPRVQDHREKILTAIPPDQR